MSQTPSPDPLQSPPRSRWRFAQFSISTSLALMLLAAAGYKIWNRPEILEESVTSGAAKIRRQVRRDADGNPQNAGWWMLYDNDDRPRLRGAFAQGVPSGTWEAWYASGQPQVRATCWGGQRHGMWTEWHENGQKSLEMHFDSDKADGEFRMWHADGSPACKGAFEAGVRVGRWTWWNEKGQTEVEGTYENGRPSSDWKVAGEPG